MKSFWKFFCGIFLLAIFLYPQSVFAEKTDWFDKDYNFKSVRKVAVMNLDKNFNFGGGVARRQKILEEYADTTKKLKRDVVFSNDSSADIFVTFAIKNWSSDSYVIPERTVWEQKKFTRRRKNSHGDWFEDTYYETVPVTYPPRRVDVSKVSVSFEVYDNKTGKMIFARDDVRDREDKDAHEGMFKRICNSFFEDLGKKMR